MRLDPITRCFHISYKVPGDAPDEIAVRCSWSPSGRDDWRPARVKPLLSDTGYVLATDEDRAQWAEGSVTERRAGGLTRTVIFDPYPEAQENGRVDADFRIEIGTSDTQTVHLTADNSDVVYIEDWSKVLQQDAFSEGKWQFDGNTLSGEAGTDLPQLTYPLDLKGRYAVFVEGSVGLRLTGDERTEYLSSAHGEILWRWTRMDRRHLVLKQRQIYSGPADAHINYVKLVPLTDDLARELNHRYSGEHDRMVAAYFEPYSWAFNEDIHDTLQHREPLTAFKEAAVDLLDPQIGRFGAKVVYESRLTDQLLYGTIGDPIDGKVPETGNVGRMQQYTNALEAELKYARELGLGVHANFGATNCYPGTPLQGDFSKQHPEWVNGHALRYDIPDVRKYIISLFREAIEIGAPGISMDFCRYPEGIDKAETCTTFLRELRQAVGPKLPILIRFPATGVRLWERFDYRAWVREGLVDYLCPSTIQGRHNNFDIAPYVTAVKGTKCKLLPVVDAIGWGPTMPGPFLWRVKQLYDAGADGIYIYQADDPIVYAPLNRRYVRIAGSTDALRRWWHTDELIRPECSKGIYITRPMRGEAYSPWERLRVWLEGIPQGEVEMYLDGKLINRYEKPPYTLGTEDYDSDKLISPGEHTLRIRARDGDGWLEETFAIRG
ncbi:MAG: hypothetical protein KBC96_12915 [Armatimonadetes bacterium]|nr:hypothetical protein [Armatimonadota bacterium]